MSWKQCVAHGGEGRQGGGGGQWINQKHDEKQRRRKHIRRQILKLPRANSAYYISHLIIWQGLFWRWLFVSHFDWNNYDRKLVFLLLLQREKTREVVPALPVTPT